MDIYHRILLCTENVSFNAKYDFSAICSHVTKDILNQNLSISSIQRIMMIQISKIT